MSVSSVVQLRGPTGLSSRKWKLVKFCNGEVMGRKLRLTQLEQHGGGGGSGCTKNVRQHICMSLTADMATESKV